MADSSRQSVIPLHCSLCPKDPKFSDLSHLLTHVASKGHLSHQFKTTVRVKADPVAKAKLDAYNHWYEKYGIERLLSARIALKDDKDVKSTRAKRGRASINDVPAKRTKSSIDHSGVSQAKPESSNAEPPDPVDPRLAQIDGMASPPCLPRSADCSSLSIVEREAHVPRMYLWSTTAPGRYQSPSYSGSPSFTTDDFSVHGFTFDDVNDPFIDRNLESRITPPQNLPSLESRSSENGVEGHKRADVQLKGIIWPGMSLFDSATPEMQRKRNQKKDGSTLIQLAESSAQVEALEQTYGDDGELQVERPIWGLLDDSPIKKRAASPKKPSPRAPRPVLRDLSINVPQARMSSRVKTEDNTKARDLEYGTSRRDMPFIEEPYRFPSESDRCLSILHSPNISTKRDGPRGERKAKDFTVFCDDGLDQRPSDGPSTPLRPAKQSDGNNKRDQQPLGTPQGFTVLNSGHPMTSRNRSGHHAMIGDDPLLQLLPPSVGPFQSHCRTPTKGETVDPLHQPESSYFGSGWGRPDGRMHNELFEDAHQLSHFPYVFPGPVEMNASAHPDPYMFSVNPLLCGSRELPGAHHGSVSNPWQRLEVHPQLDRPSWTELENPELGINMAGDEQKLAKMPQESCH
ncbi:MAG: hypothetical protein M1817_001768 [Caeruleum heppii]|nr:MAG: hypothetical protein M1817_001768 [Caeruleum heppii]